jgi:acyl-CoA dehydrogenase
MTSQLDDNLLSTTLTRIFTEQTQVVPSPASEGEFAEASWRALREAGMTSLGVAEAAGGSGGEVADACTLLRLAGRHGVALPLAECSLLGGWLLERTNFQLPMGLLSVPVARGADSLVIEWGRLRGRLTWVPWGEAASTVVAVADSPEGERVVLIDPMTADIDRGHNMAGEPRDALTFNDVVLPGDRCSEPQENIRHELKLRGALSRSLLMAGAMEAVADLTVRYANERKQFGRSIAAFQAVGNRLAQLCAESESSSLAADVAAQRFAEIGVAAAFEIAATKANISRAATVVASHAHQVHGAIGMTQEYPLHRFTTRLWGWRQEWGSERMWSESLGQMIDDLGAVQIWPRLTEGLKSP